jgi:hypothetical protein
MEPEQLQRMERKKRKKKRNPSRILQGTSRETCNEFLTRKVSGSPAISMPRRVILTLLTPD